MSHLNGELSQYKIKERELTKKVTSVMFTWLHHCIEAKVRVNGRIWVLYIYLYIYELVQEDNAYPIYIYIYIYTIRKEKQTREF